MGWPLHVVSSIPLTLKIYSISSCAVLLNGGYMDKSLLIVFFFQSTPHFLSRRCMFVPRDFLTISFLLSILISGFSAAVYSLLSGVPHWRFTIDRLPFNDNQLVTSAMSQFDTLKRGQARPWLACLTAYILFLLVHISLRHVTSIYKQKSLFTTTTKKE